MQLAPADDVVSLAHAPGTDGRLALSVNGKYHQVAETRSDLNYVCPELCVSGHRRGDSLTRGASRDASPRGAPKVGGVTDSSESASVSPSTDMRDPLVDALIDVLGTTQVLTDPASLAAAANDRSDAGRSALARVLVRPTTTEQVAAVMRQAYDEAVPVVVQGRRTGVAGGADAVPGAIVLDTTAMDQILAIRTADQLAVVQPGVITHALAEAVAAQGLYYPVDPGSVFISTLGGNIATNAGGMRCVKYGVTRDRVRSLTVVLADGTIVRTGHDSVKGVAGYDLTSLLVGSEGTLGVITEATVSLLPLPSQAAGAAGMFSSLHDALAAAESIMAGARRPSALELLDRTSMQAINAYSPTADLPDDASAMLIVESDELDRCVADVEDYARIFEQHAAVDVRVARTSAEVSSLLDIRRNLHPGLVAKYGSILTEDIAVPRGRLLELVEVIEQTQHTAGVVIATGGHVGDGNLHPLIGFDAADPSSRAAAEAAFREIIEHTLRLGGTVTGEHGVGTVKRSVVTHELSEALRELQVRVKAAFDPKGILNPGKKI